MLLPASVTSRWWLGTSLLEHPDWKTFKRPFVKVLPSCLPWDVSALEAPQATWARWKSWLWSWKLWMYNQGWHWAQLEHRHTHTKAHENVNSADRIRHCALLSHPASLKWLMKMKRALCPLLLASRLIWNFMGLSGLLCLSSSLSAQPCLCFIIVKAQDDSGFYLQGSSIGFKWFSVWKLGDYRQL